MLHKCCNEHEGKKKKAHGTTWGQKLKFVIEKNIMLRKEQLRKQITDNGSSLEF
jgi:hypothetical protein